MAELSQAFQNPVDYCKNCGQSRQNHKAYHPFVPQLATRIFSQPRTKPQNFKHEKPPFEKSVQYFR
jgi:hypothetical protein